MGLRKIRFYHAIEKWHNQRDPRSSVSKQDDYVWKRLLWQIKPLPSNLIWKILSNVIPVRANLLSILEKKYRVIFL
jgi:hypothetical protein